MGPSETGSGAQLIQSLSLYPADITLESEAVEQDHLDLGKSELEYYHRVTQNSA